MRTVKQLGFDSINIMTRAIHFQERIEPASCSCLSVHEALLEHSPKDYMLLFRYILLTEYKKHSQARDDKAGFSDVMDWHLHTSAEKHAIRIQRLQGYKTYLLHAQTDRLALPLVYATRIANKLVKNYSLSMTVPAALVRASNDLALTRPLMYSYYNHTVALRKLHPNIVDKEILDIYLATHNMNRQAGHTVEYITEVL